MFCPKCGKPVEKTDHFCRWCSFDLLEKNKLTTETKIDELGEISTLIQRDLFCPVCNTPYNETIVCPTCGNNFSSECAPVYYRSEDEIQTNQNNVTKSDENDDNEIIQGWWLGLLLSWIGVIIILAINATKKPDEPQYSVIGALLWAFVTSVIIAGIFL